MNAIGVYLKIYGRCWRDALAAIGRNAWTLLLAPAIFLARDLSAGLAASLGFFGGIVLTLLTAALFSAYLSFLHDLVRGGHVSFSATELQASLGAYLWAIVNVFFVVWIATLALQLVTAGVPSATALLLALWIVASIALNAVPEVIYLRGTHGGLETIAAGWDFLKAQWIPWFAATVPVLAVVGLLATVVRSSVLGDLVVGAAFHVAMVFRGYLFQALDGSTHRRRMFQQRVA